MDAGWKGVCSMGKVANRYFGCETWRVVEEGFDPGHAKLAESVFALANERLGVRGYLEEGGQVPSLRGSYLGGVYELEGDPSAGGYKGIVKQTHYMATAPDALHTRLEADGEPLDLGLSSFEGFTRVLDLRSGLLTRTLVWQTQSGARLLCKWERLAGMEDAQWLAQRVTLECLAGEAELALAFGVDGNVSHQMYQNCLWQERQNQPIEEGCLLEVETGTTGQNARYALRVQGPGPLAYEARNRYAGLAGKVHIQAGQQLSWERAVSVAVARDANEALPPLPERWPGFEELLASNAKHYAAFWAASDVEILGDDENQQGIRFCLFQMHQAYRGLDPRDNIGAKGLTGEAYNGHAFWDSETYCLPYFLLNDHQAARNLLMYRYHTLPQALERAKELDLRGACYPLATLSGKEACTLWQHASLQMQPSTSVAYGIEIYAHQTGDRAFLHREGVEMLVQICRYLTSRGDWNQDHTTYGYYGVMGPDEFHMMVNNNFYTNYMGQKTLRFTLRTLGALTVAEGEALEEKTGLTLTELAEWKACADAMLLPGKGQGLFEQHEGYFGLPHLDVGSIPAKDFPLYEHWSYDRIYRTDMLKQPDVLMALFLHPEDFSQEEKAVNYAYYEPRCIHESSLSPSIHAVLAAELGLEQAAFHFFGYATRLDLDDYNRNTCDGLHTTGIAAAWMTIVRGFGGLRMDGDLPSLRPMLPSQWEGFSFTLLCGESRVRVRVRQGEVALGLAGGEECQVLLYGQPVRVTGRETFYPMVLEEAL